MEGDINQKTTDHPFAHAQSRSDHSEIVDDIKLPTTIDVEHGVSLQDEGDKKITLDTILNVLSIIFALILLITVKWWEYSTPTLDINFDFYYITDNAEGSPSCSNCLNLIQLLQPRHISCASPNCYFA